MKQKIYVINFPFCNYHAIERYLIVRKKTYESISMPVELKKEDVILLPGVGTFEQGMKFLEENRLSTFIKNHCFYGGRVLGICLGMQLYFEKSDESADINGLSIIPGNVEHIPKDKNFRVPHIGWNSLEPLRKEAINGREILLAGGSDYYFVHSYHVVPVNTNYISSYISHPEKRLCSSIQKGNIIGYQFHPEKSGIAGYKLLDSTFEYFRV